jgi:hypothetical protein
LFIVLLTILERRHTARLWQRAQPQLAPHSQPQLNQAALRLIAAHERLDAQLIRSRKIFVALREAILKNQND